MEVSSLQQRRRHGKVQSVPLSVMEGSENPDPRRIGEVRAKGLNVERKTGNGTEESRRLLLTENQCEGVKKPFNRAKIRVRKAQ